MKTVFFLALVVVAAVAAVRDVEWTSFKEKYGKKFKFNLSLLINCGQQ